jgi:hypothetical protein
MRTSTLPAVGFDRFVELDWAEYALELAMAEKDSKILRAWLEDKISGEVSARKTSNVLTNLWLKTYPETGHLRERALILARETTLQDHMVLHWGMALANFPFFCNTTATIGRLMRIQGHFQVKEVSQRMLETNSNQGTVLRMVARIVQSLHNWNILEAIGKRQYKAVPDIEVVNTDLLGWLFHAALNAERDRHWVLLDVLRLPELFPFDVAGNGMAAIRKVSGLTITREGMDREYVMVDEG